MVMPKFEGVQLQVLTDCKQSQLISAGAGSGKTTIMIEKLSDLILNKNVSVENLLVVTFTVLAANEMKERLINKLKSQLQEVNGDKAQEVLKLIDDIKTASIDTIDGFSSKTIKKYFYKLGISPNIEIVSDNTKDYYLTKAMNKTIKDFSKDEENVNLLIDLYGGNRRNLDAVKDMILSNYYNIINLKEYEEFLNRAEAEYADSIKSEKIVNDHICKYAYNLKQEIINNISSFESDVQKVLKDFVLSLNNFNMAVSFITNLTNFYGMEFPKFTPKTISNNAGLNEICEQIKEFAKFKEKLQKNCIDENFNEKNAKIAKILHIFVDLLKNFIKNYNSLKEKNNVIDFNDLNRLMLKLLNMQEVKEELCNKYKYVFVDECQDINPLQNELILKLTDEQTNIFMVGDVKQSIYGFRGASPELFLDRYKQLKENKDFGMAYDMNVNFRSSPKVLNFVNEIFSKLMTEQTADIEYKKNALIQPKRDDIFDGKVKLIYVCEQAEKAVAHGVYSVKENSNSEGKVKINPQALLVLKTITELIGTNFYDASINKIRQLTYKDIAVLVRTEKDDASVNLIELLKACRIPLNINNKLDVESSEGIKLILSILKCVAKTADDVDYLSCFMALTDLTIDDIVAIRNKEKSLYENLIENLENEQIKAGFNSIKEIEYANFTKTNSSLIRYILNEQKLKYFLLKMKNGQGELNKIEEFLNKISVVEDGLGLCEFIEVVESNVSKSGDFASQDNEDSVTIQTIHKSKGLEYPVVIMYNVSKTFSYLGDHEGINFDADIGLGVDYFDSAERIKYYSLPKLAINLKNREKGYKEELRLLYVALTRAKNQLYIFGTCSQKALKERNFNKTSFGNMILSCFSEVVEQGVVGLKNCEIEIVDEVDYYNLLTETAGEEVETFEEFSYGNSQKFGISFKNTVTGLNSELSQTNKFDLKAYLKPNIQYGQTEDKAQIGTHYHKALEELDFEKVYEQNTNFDDVDYAKVEKAYNVLSKLIKNSIKHYKEADFEMYLPYSELVDSCIDDKVIVQGVVDLIIERENDIDIVDYKFSNLKIESLKEKYAEQLELYKKAVENAFKKPVKNTYIYSVNTGELK